MFQVAVLTLLPAVVAFAAEPVENCEMKLQHTLVKFQMVKVPAGSIEMKDAEGNAQTVQIKPFWIGKHELTWDQYDAWKDGLDLANPQVDLQDMLDKTRPSPPYGAPDHGWGHNGSPALHLAHPAAVLYCKWLSEKTGKKYRLPTEAEWEYACRAGSAAEKLDPEALKKVAWFGDNSENENGEQATRPVGQKEPNAWGLYDMLGNVAEWIDNGDGKMIVKGGHFQSSAAAVHSKARLPYKISWQERDPQDPKSEWWLSDGAFAGFRLVRED